MAIERPILTKVAVTGALVGGALGAVDFTGFATKLSDIATREVNSARISEHAARQIGKAESALQGLRVNVNGKTYGCEDKTKIDAATDNLLQASGRDMFFGNLYTYNVNATSVFKYSGEELVYRREDVELAKKQGTVIIAEPGNTNPYTDDAPVHFDEGKIEKSLYEKIKKVYLFEDSLKVVKEGRASSKEVEKIKGKVCVPTDESLFSSLKKEKEAYSEYATLYRRNADHEKRNSHGYALGVVGAGAAFMWGTNRIPLLRARRKAQRR